MKELLQLFPSYIKNSTDLIKDLKAINIPQNAKLFTADASSMYTNIDTATGLQVLNNIFSTYENRISPIFPREFFLTVLELIMNILTSIAVTALSLSRSGLRNTMTKYQQTSLKLCSSRY